MEALPHPEPLAPTLQDAFHLLAHDLRAALPPVSDTPGLGHKEAPAPA